jgi:hypothetical protein
MVDLKNGLAARHCYPIAYQWYGWWLRGSGFLAGFGHDSVSRAQNKNPIICNLFAVLSLIGLSEMIDRLQ